MRKKAIEINEMLWCKYYLNQFVFVINSNIGKDLCDDNLHLSFQGTRKLANNFANVLNSLLFSKNDAKTPVKVKYGSKNPHESVTESKNEKKKVKYKLVIVYLNINSLSYTFERVKAIFKNKFDILVLNETNGFNIF